jgi:hypothetical protein
MPGTFPDQEDDITDFDIGGIDNRVARADGFEGHTLKGIAHLGLSQKLQGVRPFAKNY